MGPSLGVIRCRDPVAGCQRWLTSEYCQCTFIVVIRSFRHRGLRRFWEGDPSRTNPALRERLENVLAVLDAAGTAQDVDLPGYRLHSLKGELRGFWSVTISGNWRVTFRIENGDVFDVDLTDYH